MFTGIITDTGTIVGITESNDIITFDIKTAYDMSSLEIGESVAVQGVCLTVVKIDSAKHVVSFDIIPETLDKTNLGKKQVGDVCNLERSLRAGDRISGHFVQGHVDTTIAVREKVKRGDSLRVYFELPREHTPFIKMKGSVALDGISLTVSSVEQGRFSVDLIPQTLTETTFGELQVGDSINMEIDMLARYVHDTQPE